MLCCARTEKQGSRFPTPEQRLSQQPGGKLPSCSRPPAAPETGKRHLAAPVGDKCDNWPNLAEHQPQDSARPFREAEERQPAWVRVSRQPLLCARAGGWVPAGRKPAGAPCRPAPEEPAHRPRSCGAARVFRAAHGLAQPAHTRTGAACLSKRELPAAGAGRGPRGWRGEERGGVIPPRPLPAPGPPLRSRPLSRPSRAAPAGARGRPPGSPSPGSGPTRAALCARRGWTASPPASAPRRGRSPVVWREERLGAACVRVWARAGEDECGARAGQGRRRCSGLRCRRNLFSLEI